MRNHQILGDENKIILKRGKNRVRAKAHDEIKTIFVAENKNYMGRVGVQNR